MPVIVPVRCDGCEVTRHLAISCFNYEQEKYHWILIAYPNKILTQPKNVLILFELLIISLTLTLFAKKMI